MRVRLPPFPPFPPWDLRVLGEADFALALGESDFALALGEPNDFALALGEPNDFAWRGTIFAKPNAVCLQKLTGITHLGIRRDGLHLHVRINAFGCVSINLYIDRRVSSATPDFVCRMVFCTTRFTFFSNVNTVSRSCLVSINRMCAAENWYGQRNTVA